MRLKNQKKHYLDVDFFKEINTPEKAYWFGFLVADGYVSKYKTNLALKDKDPIIKFSQAIKTDIPVCFNASFDKRTKKSYSRYSIQICSKKFSEHLIKLGIKNLKNDRAVIKVDKKFISDFYRGLFDGDGSICIVGNSIRVSLIATKDILDQLVNILSFKDYVFTTVKDNIKKINFYSDSRKFLEFIYEKSSDQTRLDRKYKLYKNLFLCHKKYLLIDADGTICETKDIHYKALNLALKNICNYEISINDHIEKYDGLPTTKKLKILCDLNIIKPDLLEQISKEKQRFTALIMEKDLKRSIRLISVLKSYKRMGFKIAICSNMIRESLEVVLRKLDITDLIDFSLSNNDVKNCKPAPDIYLQAMELFKTSPSECIVIEDNQKGIDAAIAANIDFIQIKSPSDLNKNLLLNRISIL